MAEIRDLKYKRAAIKSQVTRMQTFFDSEVQKTVVEARVRQTKLEECWKKFEEVQTQIDSRPTENNEAYEQQQRDGEAERQLFETSYYKIAEKIDAVINHRQEHDQQVDERANHNQQGVVEAPRRRPKLPEIKLPEFNGDYTKWLFFKNSFETTIDQEVELTQMQKHQYLVGVLRGEALNVIQGYQISNENYADAWKLLKDTYDNKIVIIETHLDELLQFPMISKEEKADGIRQFVWHIRTHMSSLKSLSQPVDQWETMIIHLAKKKLDFVEQRDWQNTINNRTAENMPTMEEFLKFLTDRCNTLRVLNQGKTKQLTSKPTTQKKPEKKVSLTVTSSECRFCKGSHSVYKCEELQKLTPDERKKEIIGKQLCLNCLGSGHYARECKSSSCKKCSKRHNTLLHRETESQSKEASGSNTTVAVTYCTQDQATRSDESERALSIYYAQRSTSAVILSTARVNAYDVEGNPHMCRVLLDPGSQSNIITENFARRLGLPNKTGHQDISGINQARISARKVMEVQIQSIYEGFSARLECLVLPSITEQLPQKTIDVTRIVMPKDVRMADPRFHEPGTIDMLIGAGLYWRILIGTARNRIEGQPALQNTQLGWIIGGEMPGQQSKPSLTHLSVTNDVLNQQSERFWKQEEFRETPEYSDEEKYCEEYFASTVKRDNDGRFIVRLPKREQITLGDSKDQATRRLVSLERRFLKNTKLEQEYIKFMDDYIEKNHMTAIGNEKRDSETYVLPHQAVVRPDSLTTKLRVVFDASAKTTLGTSLNDKLIPGPNLQKDLVDIILRFRTHAYVITADVTMMYRQITVDPRDRSLQRILWRRNPNDAIQTFELNTVTYGTSCAPYLAIRCLRELAMKGVDLPRAARAVNEDCYMDDVLTGARTINEVVNLQKQLTELLLRGQFRLRKWRANNARILQHLTEKCKTDSLLTLDNDGALKTLGLLWDAASDCLRYKIEISQICTATKRIILSKIAQVFDPLGLIAPLLISGKIIMQQLWLLEIEWDQPLPQESLEIWERYYASLPRINELCIPRNVVPNNRSDKFDIFGFGDASEKAYGACLYAVSTNDKEDINSHLILAKSKVAPLKTISVPRLELNAALLLAKLYSTAKNAYGDRIREVKLWSDSTIVLGWIKTQPNLLKTFVANRISKIQALTREVSWHHVPSEDNPADMLSRGVTIERLIDGKLWWNGPQWITTENQWPATMEQPEKVLPELKPPSVTLTVTTMTSILERYSTYKKLVRVIAFCLRWKRKKSETRNSLILSVEELEEAEKTIIRIVQRENFPRELHELKRSQEMNRRSKLRALDPYLDAEGLIRVGGRLHNAIISEGQKHPMVLPPKHFVTNLIMQAEHVRLHHCPPEQLLSSVRHRFWPLSGRREAHKVTKKCLKCFRFRPAYPDIKMGDLPRQRVSGNTRPFAITGIDYAGPLQVRESRRRGRIHVSKGYVAVFTCFNTKAVHLELVTELTTEAFLAALRRFTARRGICSQLFSDNATNFVGAARELREIYDFLEKEKTEIETNLANQRIQWTFIPPRAPNFGGLWEAAVKVAKRHLYTMTRGLTLTFEEYYTLLTEIEAIMNSRPLTPISSDPGDLSVLTPSHFLIGDSLLQPAQHNLTEIPDNRLSRWQHLQKIRQNFWRRWQSEYLHELQLRKKWTVTSKNIALNTIVLLKEDHLPPLQWVIGRVVEVYPGPDGIVRVVSVRTQGGIFKRAVRNLCPIPISDREEEGLCESPVCDNSQDTLLR